MDLHPLATPGAWFRPYRSRVRHLVRLPLEHGLWKAACGELYGSMTSEDGFPPDSTEYPKCRHCLKRS